MKSFILSLGLVLGLTLTPLTDANAGDKERGIVYGVVGTLLLNELAKNQRNQYYQGYYPNPYVYGYRPLPPSYNSYQYDAYERDRRRREREYAEWSRQRAYFCSQYPRVCYN